MGDEGAISCILDTHGLAMQQPRLRREMSTSAEQ